jgi:hypothetical protein
MGFIFCELKMVAKNAKIRLPRKKNGYMVCGSTTLQIHPSMTHELKHPECTPEINN